MTSPLFNDHTIQAMRSFFASTQHAVIIDAPNTNGLTDLVNVGAQNALDSYIIVPVEQQGKSISIETIRNLKQSMSLRQVSRQERIVLIDKAELMTIEAQNSFLKLLEEPPAGVKLVLITSDVSRLLMTIRSRAATISVRPVGLKDAEDYYAQNGYKIDDIQKYYAIADGQPGLLFSLIQQDNNDYIQAIEQAKSIIKSTPYERLLLVDKLTKEKEQVPELLSALSDVLRVVSRSAALAANSSTKTLADRRRIIMNAQRSIERNANTKLVLCDVFLSI